MTNAIEQVVRIGIDWASQDIRGAATVVAAGLVMGAVGWLWSKRKGKQ